MADSRLPGPSSPGERTPHSPGPGFSICRFPGREAALLAPLDLIEPCPQAWVRQVYVYPLFCISMAIGSQYVLIA